MSFITDLLGGVADAQIATSTVTDTVANVGNSFAQWLYSVLPTVFLYIVPLILLWLFVRFVIRVGRGG